MPITSSASGVKAGTVAFFAANSTPPGWLKANGATISRAAYAALFAAIGTTYGAGDGVTTFKIPDCRGEFLRGLDDGRGVDTGRAIGSEQAGQNKSHNHGGASGAAGAHSHTSSLFSSSGPFGRGTSGAGGQTTQEAYGARDLTSNVTNHTHTIETEGGTEARPRNVAMLACIKY